VSSEQKGFVFVVRKTVVNFISSKRHAQKIRYLSLNAPKYGSNIVEFIQAKNNGVTCAL